MPTAVKCTQLPPYLFLSGFSHSCLTICANCPTSALTLQCGVWASTNDCVGWPTTMCYMLKFESHLHIQ